jgi:membrane-associated phospholipid phosphatase
MSPRRIGLAWLPFVATLVPARSHRIGRWERVSTLRLNQMPETLNLPLWVVMQAGTAGAPVIAGATALAGGRPDVARRLSGSGLTAYVLAKCVKRVVRRGRPGELLVGIRIRGRPATGGGYVSGHAAVATALAVEALPLCAGAVRSIPVGVATVVAVARVYVGAHLPLDALGGAALGWAVSRTAFELRRRSGPNEMS